MAMFPRLLGGGEMPSTVPGEVVDISPRGLPRLVDQIKARQRVIAEIDGQKAELAAENVRLDNEREQHIRKLSEDQQRLEMIVSPLMTETGQ